MIIQKRRVFVLKSFYFLQNLESYRCDSKEFCNKVHKWCGEKEAEEKRTQTREYLKDLMNKKYTI